MTMAVSSLDMQATEHVSGVADVADRFATLSGIVALVRKLADEPDAATLFDRSLADQAQLVADLSRLDSGALLAVERSLDGLSLLLANGLSALQKTQQNKNFNRAAAQILYREAQRDMNRLQALLI